MLTSREKTVDFNPMCHIGIMTSVFTHEYRFEELDLPRLQILRFEREARVGPAEYRTLRLETCIGVYARRVTPTVTVIGNVEPTGLYDEPSCVIG